MPHIFEWLIFIGKTAYCNSYFRIRTLRQDHLRTPLTANMTQDRHVTKQKDYVCPVCFFPTLSVLKRPRGSYICTLLILLFQFHLSEGNLWNSGHWKHSINMVRHSATGILNHLKWVLFKLTAPYFSCERQVHASHLHLSKMKWWLLLHWWLTIPILEWLKKPRKPIKPLEIRCFFSHCCRDTVLLG